jgi:hypothetical protein
VFHEGEATGAVQHFGAPALHTRAEAGRKDYDAGLHLLSDYPLINWRDSAASFTAMEAEASGS